MPSARPPSPPGHLTTRPRPAVLAPAPPDEAVGVAGTRSPEPSVPVVRPGSPGGPTLDAPPPGEPDLPAEPPYNEVDVTFVQQMIPHHAQALEMAALVPERAQSERVIAFAERIAAAQGPEILVLNSWLQARELPVPPASSSYGHGGHGGHGAGSAGAMPGMATPEQLAALADARGAAFDRMFLELMTEHHRGALEMAEAVMLGGEDVLAAEMATHVSVGQAAEIDAMATLLDG